MTKHFVSLFPSRAITQCLISWREALERFRVSGFWYNNLILALTGSLSVEWCIAARMFWESSKRVSTRSGALFLALYLKQARVCLQRYAAGDSIPASLSPPVSLTRCGLPRIIPSFHRKKIRAGDTLVIQFYMSLFSFSKVIPLAKRIKAKLFESIVSPSTNEQASTFTVADVRRWIEPLIRRYVPKIESIVLRQHVEFVPTWKTTPGWAPFRKRVRDAARRGSEKARRALPFLKRPSCFPGFLSELACSNMTNPLPFSGYKVNILGALHRSQVFKPFDDRRNATKSFVSAFISESPSSVSWSEFVLDEGQAFYLTTPRLCMACTGDGKRRLFTIGNYVRQRYLSPLHDWCEEVLRTIEMDGTFDQVAPLDRLKGTQRKVFSIDLTAATDRWPVKLMEDLVAVTFGDLFALAAVRTLLANNHFRVTFLSKRYYVRFAVGQPLGYHSSWPLFALSHHVLIWYAADQVYRGFRFTQYAVLGDDVVILDRAVNDQYRELLRDLGVQISEGKSLSSRSGAGEFAKKFRLKGLTIDVSPISLKRISKSREPIGWITFISSLPKKLTLQQALRIGGLGFKASSRPIGSRKNGRKARYMGALWIQYQLRLKGITSVRILFNVLLNKIVHHQVIAKVYREMLLHFSPKDLVDVPDEVFDVTLWAEEDAWGYLSPLAYERYLYRQWLIKHLAYLEWYYSLFYNRDVTLDTFFDAPIYIRTWNAPKKDLDFFRFGALYRMIDMAGQFSDNELVLEIEEWKQNLCSVHCKAVALQA